jgi:hypothetical protein
MHWLGPYEIKFVIDGGVVQLQDLTGKEIQGLVNASRMKLCKDNQPGNLEYLEHKKVELYIVGVKKIKRKEKMSKRGKMKKQMEKQEKCKKMK